MGPRETLVLDIEQVLNKSKLPFRDKVNAVAQVLIDMGISLEPEQRKVPLTTSDLKEIEKAYYESPTLGKALILEGAMMLTWDS